MHLAQWKKSAFVAGHPLLDFLNTVDFQGRTYTCNRLTSYEALAAWCQVAGVITPSESGIFTAAAITSPSKAEHALAALILWREAVYRALAAILEEKPVDAEDWRSVEMSIQGAIMDASLHRDTSRKASWLVRPLDLTTVQKRLALHLHDLLGNTLITSLKKCEGCTWLFVDTSKNHRRRWCAMSTCGSRSKAQRFRQGLN